MPSPASARTLARRPSRIKRRLLAVTSLGLAGLLAGLLSGCSSTAVTETSATSFAQISGNWQFNSTSTAAVRLSALGGSLTVNGSAITGILHPLSTASQCLSTSTAIPVAGSVDSAGVFNLSAPLAGGTLSLSGNVSADRKSLSGAAYIVSGGSCAFPAAQTLLARDAPSPVTAQQYLPVSGTYTGTLTTSDGESFPLNSTITQTAQPDADGVYHVSGTAASPGNTCIPAALSATASAIDGGSISTTYTDAATSTSITGTGSSSPDASSITITNWTVQSTCGSSTGTGILTRQ